MVKARVVYQSEIMPTGEILQSVSFRDLYRFTRSRLKADLDGKLYYDCRSAIMEMGVEVTGLPGGCVKFVSISKIAHFMVTVIDKHLHEYLYREV